MAWLSDTSAATVVYMGASNFRNVGFIGTTAGAISTWIEQYSDVVREIRGLTYAAATTSAAAWSGDTGTSASVVRASEGGNYTVVVAVTTQSVGIDT